MNLFKLTDSDGYTYNRSMKWSPGSYNEVKSCENPKLCTPEVIHTYRNLNLAFLLNPNHGNYRNPKCFLSEGEVVVEDYGKAGVFGLKILKEIHPPQWVSSEQQLRVQVKFSVLCAQSVLKIFEKKHPKDFRPRTSIKAALNYLRKPLSAASAAASAAAEIKKIDFCKLSDRAIKIIMG